MVSTTAVITAAFLQLVLGISIFIEQRTDLCSTAPTLASWLFIIAIFDILLDVEIFPIRYMNVPYIFQLMVETILAVLLSEFSSLIVWCNMERISCKLGKSMLIMAGLPANIYYDWERFILGTITIAISLTFLLCVGQATDHFYLLRKKSIRSYRKTIDYLTQLWQRSKQIIWNQLRRESRELPPKSTATYVNNQLKEPRRFDTPTQNSRRQSRSRSRRYR